MLTVQIKYDNSIIEVDIAEHDSFEVDGWGPEQTVARAEAATARALGRFTAALTAGSRR